MRETKIRGKTQTDWTMIETWHAEFDRYEQLIAQMCLAFVILKTILSA